VVADMTRGRQSRSRPSSQHSRRPAASPEAQPSAGADGFTDHDRCARRAAITCVNAMTRTRGYAVVPRLSRVYPASGCLFLLLPALVVAASSSRCQRRKAGEGLGDSRRIDFGQPVGCLGAGVGVKRVIGNDAAQGLGARAGSTSASLSAASKRSSGSFSYIAVPAFSARSLPVSEPDSLAVQGQAERSSGIRTWALGAASSCCPGCMSPVWRREPASSH
jgi:hypothetical protein